MNRASLYGDLLFETIVVRSGKTKWLDKHFKRIQLGLMLLGMESEKSLSELEQDIFHSLKDKKEARVRLIISREGKGFYLPDKNTCTWEIECFELPEPRTEIACAGIYSINRKPCNPVSMVKTGNALISVLASKHAQDNGWQDAVIINEYHRICEAVASNVFVVSKGVIYTPPLSEGCIKGIIREVLIEVCLQQEIPLLEKEITIDWFVHADEVFLTNSVHPITSIRSIGNKVLGIEMANKVRQLMIDQDL